MNNTKKTEEQLVEELQELQALLNEHQQTKKDLAQDQLLLNALLNGAPSHIYFKNVESRFIKISKSLADWFGLNDPLEAVGRTDFDFFTEKHARPAYEDEREVMRTGQPVSKEEKETWPDGRETWVSTIKMPLQDEKGEIVGTFGVSSDITQRKQAEEALQKAYTEVEKRVEERTAELQREIAERERLQQEIIEAQKSALQELSTPIIPVMEHIIVMPLIGGIDTLRARDIMRALLAGIREHRAKVVILDITGVAIVDSGVANHLNKTIQAARLKGAHAIVTGISDAVAETIVDLGIDWSGIETLSDLQTGLRVALASMGLRIG
jgi:rsbT co-antagonist protein RsbR